MNKKCILLFIALSVLISGNIYPQKKLSGVDAITSADMAAYVSFLASPLLKGRMNGEPGLDIAQQFIVSQDELLGLKPANGNSYFQPYSIIINSIDLINSSIRIIPNGKDTVTIREPIYQLLPTSPANFTLSGEVVFTGYGLKQDKYGYNDFENLPVEGKILLVMTGAPTSEDGKRYLFEGLKWESFMSIQVKLAAMLFSRAKAIIFVVDPKSGHLSIDEQYPGISGQLGSSRTLKGDQSPVFQMPGMPKILFVHRTVADEILKGTGYSLDGLQKEIDKNLKPHSFLIPGKQVMITETVKSEEVIMNNIAAIVEGSDPVLRNEYVIFSGHADHIGGSGNLINAGADDDASGCAALLSLAKAFQSLEKKLLRSVLFLWVSGEEIGLIGSKFYVSNPLVPLDKSVVDINIDMIGRVKGVADTTSETPMTGPDKVFVIADNQSKELMSIAEEVDKGSRLDFDYSLSGRNHPLQLFSRSDHFNFVKKDIPILCFSTGIHTDYHTPGDVIGKIDFNKMELITRSIYQIGYAVANRKTRIVLDNPFSKW